MGEDSACNCWQWMLVFNVRAHNSLKFIYECLKRARHEWADAATLSPAYYVVSIRGVSLSQQIICSTFFLVNRSTVFTSNKRINVSRKQECPNRLTKCSWLLFPRTISVYLFHFFNWVIFKFSTPFALFFNFPQYLFCF